MSYRLVKITNYYRDIYQEYYANNPNVIKGSYKEQHAHLMAQAYGWGDFYAKAIRKMGAEAWEIVANASYLQQAWATENNCPKEGRDLLIAQLKHYKPDVVWFQDSFLYNGEFINKIRKEVPSIRLVMGYCCAPYTKTQLEELKSFDLVTTCSPLFYEQFKQAGIDSIMLYHAFAPELIQKARTSEDENIKLSFSGSLIAGKGFHATRAKVLSAVVNKQIPIQFYGTIHDLDRKTVFAKQILYIANKALKFTGLHRFVKDIQVIKKADFLTSFPKRNKAALKLRQTQKPPLFGIQMFQLLANSDISLNIHGDVAGNYAANMRLFEATGMGSCLVTEYKQNIEELFIPDKEIICYTNEADCIKKLEVLLHNPQKTKEIAKAGQKRTLSSHTYTERAVKLNDFIIKRLS